MLKLKSNFAEKGYHIYKKLKRVLEAEHLGEYVAIEPKSRDYFLGKTMDEALDKAEQKYPEAKFFVAKVGVLATASFKHRLSFGIKNKSAQQTQRQPKIVLDFWRGIC